MLGIVLYDFTKWSQSVLIVTILHFSDVFLIAIGVNTFVPKAVIVCWLQSLKLFEY